MNEIIHVQNQINLEICGFLCHKIIKGVRRFSPALAENMWRIGGKSAHPHNGINKKGVTKLNILFLTSILTLLETALTVKIGVSCLEVDIKLSIGLFQNESKILTQKIVI